MSTKSINIKNYNQSLKNIDIFRNKNYGNIDVRINNLHLTDLNKLLGKNVFKQNDAYISAETLWEIMQPLGNKRQHNSHGLTPETILRGFKDMTHPFCILKSYFNRYITISSFELNAARILIVIEINAPLRKNHKAKINKIVTIYPSDSVQSYLRNKKILYLK